MSILDLSSYSRATLEHVLHIMKLYRSSMKQIGKRASLVDPADLPETIARIEYASGIDREAVKIYADTCLKQSFPEYHSTHAPTLEENPLLGGGVRVFVGDDMVDVTLSRFESLLKA